MLPELNKKSSIEVGMDARNSQPKLNSGENDARDNRAQAKSVSAKKVRYVIIVIQNRRRLHEI